MSTSVATSLPKAPSTPSPTSAPRASKFTEGSPLTGPEVLSQTSPSNTLLFSILSEMDEHERRRQRRHRDSNSSTESFISSGSISGPSSPPREGRRSIVFNKRSVDLVRQSLDETRNDASEKAKGFKGRLRALTGGRERSGSVKAYTGT